MGTSSSVSKSEAETGASAANSSPPGATMPGTGSPVPEGPQEVPDRPQESRGSTVGSDVGYLPDFGVQINAPTSAQLQSPPVLSQSSGRSDARATHTAQVLSPSSGNPQHTTGDSSHTSTAKRHTPSSCDSQNMPPMRQSSLFLDADPPELSPEQRDMIQECLWSIQSVLGLQFDPAAIYDEVKVVTCGGGEVNLCKDSKARGICIVESGELEIFTGEGGGEMIDVLRPGAFCGELSALFRVPQFIRAVSRNGAKLLLIPSPVVQENLVGAYMSRKVMMQWCVKKSYIESSKFFKGGTLCREIILNCFKCSSFQKFSHEALDFIASMVKLLLFKKGDVLLEIGEQPVYAYFIARGSIEIFLDGETEMKIVKYSDEGYCIGDKELFSGQPMAQHVTATSPLLVIPVGADLLVEVANSFPSEMPKLQELLGVADQTE